MIVVNNLITKINDLISSGSLSEQDVAALSKAVNTIEEKGVSSVFYLTELSASENLGRIVYVESEQRFYISDGNIWSTGLQFLINDKASSLRSWGSNGSGRLGDNTILDKSSPVSVVGGFTDWVQVSAGNHSLGLRSNGTAWAWGPNTNGVLGDNTITNRSSPVSIVGEFTDWTQLSTGEFHSLGIRANGTIWAWGLNSFGRLGDNTTTSRRSPVSVVGGFTDWVQVSAGGAHSFGVRANGSAWGWGLNSSGQLGDNTATNRSSPVSVVGGFTDWIQVSSGGIHSLGLKGT